MRKRNKKKKIINLFLSITVLFIIIFFYFYNNKLINLKDIKTSVIIDNKDNKLIDELNKEIDDLKKQNNNDKLLTDNIIINSSIINRSNSFWFNNITINKGKKDNIKKGYAVTSNNVFIGYISHVNNNSSIVKLITNNDENYISAKFTIDNVNYYGIIKKYNIIKNELYLENVIGDINVNNEDVVTSGLTMNMPSGIYIGKIKDINKDKYNLSNTIIIEPGTNYNDINLVEVIGND